MLFLSASILNDSLFLQKKKKKSKGLWKEINSDALQSTSFSSQIEVPNSNLICPPRISSLYFDFKQDDQCSSTDTIIYFFLSLSRTKSVAYIFKHTSREEIG